MIDYLSAYWKLAMKRYVEQVVMVVTDSYTAPKRIEEVESRLPDAILHMDDEGFERLFRQDPGTKQRRSELKDTQAKMYAAKEHITQFTSGHMYRPPKKLKADHS